MSVEQMVAAVRPNEGVAEALDGSIARYIEANPASAALHRRAQSAMPGGNTRSVLHFDPFPLYMAESSGARLRDADGHDYLDVVGEYSAGLYGHGDPQIKAAIAALMERGISNGGPGEPEIILAELICERFPSIERVRFCNSGTEANLCALSLARIAAGRSKFIGFSGGYHGSLLMLGRGGSPMNLPFDWTLCEYNDIAGVAETIGAMGDELAAVILEPMLSNGGCIPVRPGFLEMLRARTREVGAVLIFDEVVTSRMGPGGLQAMHGVTPDLTTLGKYLGGGFSFGAFGGRADLLSLMDPTQPGAVPHAGTFNNNLFSMTAGAVGLGRIFTPERAQTLYDDGERLRGRLNAAAKAITPNVQFTGCGSIMNIHFLPGEITTPKDLDAERADLVRVFHLDLILDGIYAMRRGQINLSLPMGPADFDRIVEGVVGFLERRAHLLQDAVAT
jgi:glutamate-1-semialdehyde 2,1-aminomutase